MGGGERRGCQWGGERSGGSRGQTITGDRTDTICMTYLLIVSLNQSSPQGGRGAHYYPSRLFSFDVVKGMLIFL